MFGDVLEAKAAASKADASFRYLDSPYQIDAEYGGDDLAMAEIRSEAGWWEWSGWGFQDNWSLLGLHSLVVGCENVQLT